MADEISKGNLDLGELPARGKDEIFNPGCIFQPDASQPSDSNEDAGAKIALDDFSNPDRTWMCSILFLNIVNYSSQSVQLHMEWKRRFNRYLEAALREVPEAERRMLDKRTAGAKQKVLIAIQRSENRRLVLSIRITAARRSRQRAGRSSARGGRADGAPIPSWPVRASDVVS